MTTEKDSTLRVRLTQRQSDELDAILMSFKLRRQTILTPFLF